MKFFINKKALKDGLDIVNHATATITTTPILENILMKVWFNHITLVSNNLEMAIEYIISEGIKIEKEGSFCIPSKLFSSYINLVDDDEIEVELLSNDNLQLKTSSWKIKFKGRPADDFPLIPKIKEEINIKITGEVLKKSIEKTLFSCAEGNIRPTLAGIYMQVKNSEAIFASTDSFRLSEYRSPIVENESTNFSQIIPSKTAFEIKSIIKEEEMIHIVSWENQIGFFFGNTKVYSRLLNWKFPDYAAFFPASYTTKASVNKSDLSSALKKINLISRENNYTMRMSFSSERGILLETSETQIGEGEVVISSDIEGENNIIGINSTYFLEALSVIDTTHINISFENPLAPILITPIVEDARYTGGSFKHIIMPLKI